MHATDYFASLEIYICQGHRKDAEVTNHCIDDHCLHLRKYLDSLHQHQLLLALPCFWGRELNTYGGPAAIKYWMQWKIKDFLSPVSKFTNTYWLSRNFLKTFSCSGRRLSGSNYFFTAVKVLMYRNAHGEMDQ